MRAIFTFHSIDEKGSIISYRPKYFSMLLETLADRDIPVLDLGTLLKPGTRKGVAITFDDGMRSVHTNALPVLREYGIPAHMFLSTDAVDSDRPWPRNAADGYAFDMLSWNEIESLHEGGVLIESHTHTHPDMRTLTITQMEEECERADDRIAGKLGRRPEYFAYPFGYHNRMAREFARKMYKGSVTTELRKLGVAENSAALPRLDTYYLQSERCIRNIDSGSLQGYLALRNILRNIRGSQCTASCN